MLPRALLFFPAVAGIMPALVGAQRVISVDITRGPAPSFPRKRADGTYQADIANNHDHGGYLAHIKMGTPPQSVDLFVDTGSSDTWVFDAGNNACKSGQCVSTFDPSASSSYRTLSRGHAPFNITYGDGSSLGGDWFTDTLEVAGAAVKSLQMAVATRSSPTLRHGIMGLGFAANEASAVRYPNLMDQLHDQGLIGTKAFSLYLNDFEAESGNILLGGVDRARYTGDLIAMPIVATLSNEYRQFTVALAAMTLTDGGGQTTTLAGSGVAAVLDAGTTLSHLPPAAVDGVVRALGAVRTGDADGRILVDCGLLRGPRAAALDVRFGGADGPVVRVPVGELVLDVVRAQVQDGSLPLPPGGLPFADACLLGLVAARGDVAIVGQTILRSAYVVYDMANLQVAMAQARFRVTASDVAEFGTNASGIPNTATGYPAGDDDASGDDTGDLLPTVTVTSTDGVVAATGTGNAAVGTVQALAWEDVGAAALTAACVVLGSVVAWI